MLHDTAASVRIVTFRDLPEHGDVSDWLALGHSADELMELTEAAEEYRPFEDAVPHSSTPIIASLDEDGAPRLSDTWNGRRLVTDQAGEILWCDVFKAWFVWDGTRYSRDVTREVGRRAERTVTSLYSFAGSLADRGNRQKLAEWALQSESRHRITNMIESSKRMVPVHPNQFDTDLMSFNTLNGTIDLRTQTLRPHSKTDLLTKRADVQFDPDATCPLWLGFLDRIFAGNDRVMAFVQRLFGYCLTGLTDEQIIVIMYGTGANGKSTLLGVLRTLCGEYAHHCRPEVFTARRNDSQGFELVPLAGARVVTSTETGAGRRLDEALVKEMTGGEPLTCAPKVRGLLHLSAGVQASAGDQPQTRDQGR
jgi:putative DNA primase/helicase